MVQSLERARWVQIPGKVPKSLQHYSCSLKKSRKSNIAMTIFLYILYCRWFSTFTSVTRSVPQLSHQLALSIGPTTRPGLLHQPGSCVSRASSRAPTSWPAFTLAWRTTPRSNELLGLGSADAKGPWFGPVQVCAGDVVGARNCWSLKWIDALVTCIIGRQSSVIRSGGAGDQGPCNHGTAWYQI